jgi:hypothetical protein
MVIEALVPLWKASDRLFGKPLQALLPLLLETLERHGHLALDLEMKEKLLTISSATIDRLLVPVRKISALQRRTPVQFNGWGEVKEAGWLEIDPVAHCGKWMEARSGPTESQAQGRWRCLAGAAVLVGLLLSLVQARFAC